MLTGQMYTTSRNPDIKTCSRDGNVCVSYDVIRKDRDNTLIKASDTWTFGVLSTALSTATVLQKTVGAFYVKSPDALSKPSPELTRYTQKEQQFVKSVSTGNET
jgi:hypothetical protein